jgi:fibrillarin-like pre-rRNA processing protein
MAVTNPFRELEGVSGVYTTGRTLMTVNSARDTDVYGERLVEFQDVQYRAWDPGRSKLAALILLGGKDLGLGKSSKVLYLGAASGTTASHVADITSSGVVFCVEVSQRSFRDLVGVCEKRKNMMPIMADASDPGSYAHMVEGVDLVYQDIAQRDQAEIFVRNLRRFGVERGILMLKARSIDVNRDPGEVFAAVRKELASKGVRVLQVVDLDDYAKDHAAFVVGP